MHNRSMPASAVIPVLSYPDVEAASRWLCEAFGFELRLTIANHRAQLGFGEGAVVVIGRGGRLPPDGEAISAMVRVADVDAHCRALPSAWAGGLRAGRSRRSWRTGRRAVSALRLSSVTPHAAGKSAGFSGFCSTDRGEEMTTPFSVASTIRTISAHWKKCGGRSISSDGVQSKPARAAMSVGPWTGYAHPGH